MAIPKSSLVAAVLAGVAYGLLARLAFAEDSPLAEYGVMTLTFIFLVPMVVGYVAVTSAGYRRGQTVVAPVATTVAVLVAAVFVGVEGIICAIIMAPVFLVMAMLGGMVARAVRRAGDRRMRVTALGLMLLLPYVAAPVEGRFGLPDMRRTVENRVVIDADAATVWSKIIRVPPIRRDEYRTSFVHRIGFPRPIEATLSYEGVGGVRAASFERGVVFRETVTEWVPQRRLSFTIAADSIPRESLDEHVTIGGDYFDVLDGTYEIVPLPSGRVELRLSSTHRLSTHFNTYASFWSDLVMRQIQSNILQVVRARAEEKS